MELIELLEKLREQLNNSGVQRTAGLLSTMGDDCFYYKKSLDIFERNDFDPIKDLLVQCLERMEKIDG